MVSKQITGVNIIMILVALITTNIYKIKVSQAIRDIYLIIPLYMVVAVLWWWLLLALFYVWVIILYDKRCFLLSHFIFPAVLVEWVQAAHLQGQDDPDHQVWNQGYKSKYVELKDEAGNRE